MDTCRDMGRLSVDYRRLAGCRFDAAFRQPYRSVRKFGNPGVMGYHHYSQLLLAVQPMEHLHDQVAAAAVKGEITDVREL